DLSGCSGLKSLSLAGAPALTELKLPGSTAVEEITLTGSRIYSLPLSGSTSLISLDLNGSAILTSLDVSGCSSLRTLDVSRCVNLSTLNLSGCSALEKLAATGCVSLTSLSLTPGGHLRELNVGGANFLKSLEVGGQALGHLDLDGLTMLTAPNCSEQLISGVPMNRTLNMKNYVGNGLSRVSGIHGYAGDNTEIELTSWNGGVATFASVPDTVSYFYNTAGLNNKTMDVTLTLNGAPDGDGPTSNRGSGGGCDAGFGLAELLALVGLALRRRK
ncbi:MAG: SYNERG-CTERM sorting domain-containing protein, partial [Fretibacterium sp.]|nr:SYNERG-CTERM sorting domain-containing protein [Fretibacterium sp.]